MRPALTQVRAVVHIVRCRFTAHLADVRVKRRASPDGGYTTETVIITALLVGCGIAALGIIASKVLDKANALNF
ncbi:hypothetical protein [Kitasatospora sp. MAP5-34]|uniref:hypothetical protein n=1 Tax=Kitasatospora sp. MAP5-34 TaxID=3035102 RepID=UPI002475E924|nr:hypothetical protein [Kitasatospora sp. MAP5-34]MDH6580790.1 hypothetical protein [Kitasatospora sp. MAP5-34]